MNTTSLAMTHDPVATIPVHVLAFVPPPALGHQTFAAVELSGDTVRLKIVRMTAAGVQQTIHDESAACPCGPAADGNEIARFQATWFVLTTLRRYASLCGAHGAILRAVATSAFARVWDCNDIVARAREEAGIDIDIISSREEACLLSLAALGGTADQKRSLLIDVGHDGARVILASGERPIALWELGFDMQQAAAVLGTNTTIQGDDPLTALRTRARKIVLAARAGSPTGGLDAVVATAGTAAMVVAIASDGGTRASGVEISRAVDRRLMASGSELQSDLGPTARDITLPGAILLEAILERLCPGAVEAVDKGLTDGVLSELVRSCGDGNVRGLA